MESRLYRKTDKAMLGGVAAGLADYFNIDVSIVRLVWILLAFPGGAGILGYIVAWIIIPPEPKGARTETHGPGAREYTGSELEELPETGDTVETDLRGRNAAPSEEELNRRRTFGGVVLLVIGGLFLLGNTLSFVSHTLRSWWPLLLVAIGIYLLYDTNRGRSS